MKKNQTNSLWINPTFLDSDVDPKGEYLASGSSEGQIFIYKVDQNGQSFQKELEILEAHKNAIWRIKWAGYQMPSIFATCSFDRALKIWQVDMENESKSCQERYSHEQGYSINDFSFGIFDSNICIITCNSFGQAWLYIKEKAYYRAIDCPFKVSEEPLNCIEWILQYQGLYAVAGCDKTLYICWVNLEQNFHQEKIFQFQEHQNWIRDLSVSCKMLCDSFYIVTVSEDQKIIIWKFNQETMSQPEKQIIIKETPILKIKFNKLGNLFAVGYIDKEGENITEAYYLDLDSQWKPTQES